MLTHVWVWHWVWAVPYDHNHPHLPDCQLCYHRNCLQLILGIEADICKSSSKTIFKPRLKVWSRNHFSESARPIDQNQNYFINLYRYIALSKMHITNKLFYHCCKHKMFDWNCKGQAKAFFPFYITCIKFQFYNQSVWWLIFPRQIHMGSFSYKANRQLCMVEQLHLVELFRLNMLVK